MKRSRRASTLCLCAAALGWLLTGVAWSADADDGQPPEEELDEVVVEGDRIKSRISSYKELQKPLDWLARLVGEFRIGGGVELLAQDDAGDPLAVTGAAVCIGFGIGPGVQCDFRALWRETAESASEAITGGASTYNPAVLLLGFDPLAGSVSYIMVDARGYADTAGGTMVSADTMRARSSCFAMAARCDQVLRISASPDGETFEMMIDRQIEQQPAVRFRFVMERIPGTPSVVYGRKQEEKK